jgi:hypothetical protein
MNRRQAQHARALAVQLLSYRAWAMDATFGPIPSLSVISNPRIHALYESWRLRRAQNGAFDAPPRRLVGRNRAR